MKFNIYVLLLAYIYKYSWSKIFQRKYPCAFMKEYFPYIR